MHTRRSAREAKRNRSRRVRAVLAGGLVLGIGASATLAAWNDSEYGSATFTAGRFDLVGAADGGGTFTNHASTGTAAALTFSATPSVMVPGAITYAMFSVKTADPSVAGTLQWIAVPPPNTGLAVFLRYGVRTIDGTACNSTTYAAGDTVVPDTSTLATNGVATRSVSANGGSTVNYCIAVTLQAAADNTVQGASAALTWQVLGTAAAP